LVASGTKFGQILWAVSGNAVSIPAFQIDGTLQGNGDIHFSNGDKAIKHQACIGFGEQTCRNAAMTASLQLGGHGQPFAGDYSETGCYAYNSGVFAGIAFYGYAYGGREVQSQAQLTPLLSSDKYRLPGTNCEADETFSAFEYPMPLEKDDGNYPVPSMTNDSRVLQEAGIGVGEIKIHKFMKNAKILVAYENYFLYAVIFFTACALARFLLRVLRKKVKLFRKMRDYKKDKFRGFGLVVMFITGMVFYAFLNTMQGLRKALEREDQCFTHDPYGVRSDEEKQQGLSDKIDEMLPDLVLEFVINCQTAWSLSVAEILTYWVGAFLVSAFVVYLIRLQSHAVRHAKTLSQNDQLVNVMPVESIMRRSSIQQFQVLRDDELEKMPRQLREMVLTHDILMSFSLDLISFVLLYEFKFPSEMAAWFPWKFMWEIIFLAFFKGLFSRFVVLAVQCHRTLALIVLLFGIFTHLVIVMGAWVVIGMLVWDFFPEGIFGRLIKTLDILVGVGTVGFLITPLTIELIFGLTSAAFWEPLVRHNYKRVLNLQNEREVTMLRLLLASGHRRNVVWFQDEFICYGWTVFEAESASGENVLGLFDSKKHTVEHPDYPLRVHVKNTKASCVGYFICLLGDLFFGVDKDMPVKPLAEKRHICPRCCYAKIHRRGRNGTNGHTNGHANGYKNGHTNGHTNGHSNGHSEGRLSLRHSLTRGFGALGSLASAGVYGNGRASRTNSSNDLVVKNIEDDDEDVEAPPVPRTPDPRSEDENELATPRSENGFFEQGREDSGEDDLPELLQEMLDGDELDEDAVGSLKHSMSDLLYTTEDDEYWQDGGMPTLVPPQSRDENPEEIPDEYDGEEAALDMVMTSIDELCPSEGESEPDAPQVEQGFDEVMATIDDMYHNSYAMLKTTLV
jgi:hypothetical protein